MESYKIAVAGTGYVGLSNAVLLSQNNQVIAYDINEQKVNLINQKISPISDEYIQKYLAEKDLNLKATLDSKEAFSDADFIIVSTPTDYDADKNYFDTSSVEAVIEQASAINPNAVIIIKSTVPVGYTAKIRKHYNKENIIFSPEFLREGKALYDNLYPSRIIVGTDLENTALTEKANEFAQLLKSCALKEDVQTLIIQMTSAEAVKLFSNTYLALRVAYFNELDTYAQEKGLNAKEIIEGVCLDPRIGNHYNNPSFGYGGYCLPKDTKQLLANFYDVPNNIIEAIIKSNVTRKHYIADTIISQSPDVVGIYRLTMKSNSDNFRESAIWDIMKQLRGTGINLVIYEPSMDADDYKGIPVEKDIQKFKDTSDIILANRFDDELNDVSDKLYTRDIYFRD